MVNWNQTKTLGKLAKTLAITSSLAILTSACSSVLAKPSSSPSAVTTKTVSTSDSMAAMTSYKLDPHHSNVRFSIMHMNTSTVTGGFYELEGLVKFSSKSKSGMAKITIPMNRIHSVSEQFTDHLKDKDFFDTANYPTATFVSTKWHFSNDKVTRIDGNLTLKGKTKPVSLRATNFNCYFSPVVKKTMCGGDFTTTLDRTQWGINKYVMMGVPKDLSLDIEIEAIKQ